MLCINWKKHYDIPNLIYSSNTSFKRNRKIRFYFLTDFLFQVIHKVSFNLVFVGYMKYLFISRIKFSCSSILDHNMKNKLFKSFDNTLNYTIWSNVLSTWKAFNNLKRNDFLNNYIRKSVPVLYIFFFYNFITNRLNEISTKVKQIIIILIKNNSDKLLSFIRYIISNQFYIIREIHNYYLIEDRYKLNIYLKRVYHIKNLVFYTKTYVSKVIYDYFFCFIEKYNKTKKIIKNTKLHRKLYLNIHKNKEKLKKIINKINNKINSFINRDYLKIYKKQHIFNKLSYFVKNLNVFFYYYFFSITKVTRKSNNLFNYLNFVNLRWKKDLLLIIKRTYLSFTRFLKMIEFYSRKRFFRFLRGLIKEYGWFVGPEKKNSLFIYVIKFNHNIIKSYGKLLLMNKNKNRSNFQIGKKNSDSMLFYYNAANLRNKLIYFLGKRRYKSEFVLINNKHFILNYYLKSYYSLTSSTLLIYSRIIKRKYNINTLKELFFFLEYKVDIFTKKYLHFNNFLNNDIFLNGVKMNSNKNMNFFFIGDILTLDNNNHMIYIKFLILFNIIYFINPSEITFKFKILHEIYYSLYHSIRDNINFSNRIKHISSTSLSSCISHIYMVIKNIDTYLKLKLVIFFILKYNLLLEIKYNISYVSNTAVFIYSIGKTYKKFKLVKFKDKYKAKKEKVLRKHQSLDRKNSNKKMRWYRHTDRKIIDLLVYKKNYSIKDKLLNTHMKYHMYSAHLFKKLNFIGKQKFTSSWKYNIF